MNWAICRAIFKSRLHKNGIVATLRKTTIKNKEKDKSTFTAESLTPPLRKGSAK
jgi:hypothetical protein